VRIFDIGLLRPPSACRPFADDTKGASEAARLQAAPKFQRRFGNRLPIDRRWCGSSELCRVWKTSWRSPRIACRTSFLLWPVWRTICLIGVPLFDRGQDSRIGLFAAKVSFKLQAFSRGEKFGIDGCRPDCAADLAHRFADSIKEGPTGVLHQMPTICDLYRVRQGLCRGFAISSTAITGDDRDRGMSSEPEAWAVAGSRSGSSVTIRRLSRLQMMLAYR
jgi:hypothetical protein